MGWVPALHYVEAARSEAYEFTLVPGGNWA